MLRDHNAQSLAQLSPAGRSAFEGQTIGPGSRAVALARLPRCTLQASVNFRRTLQRCFQLLEAEILGSRDLQNGRLAAAA